MSKILLINPPVYDLRLDWYRWHQPCGLLQVGKYLSDLSEDVRLIDCLQQPSPNRIQRAKLDTISSGESSFQRWHFGMNWEQLARRIRQFHDEPWKPDAIYITSLVTIWWESIRDLVALLRKWYPKKPIVLGGVYPRYNLAHAVKHIQGIKFDSNLTTKAKNKLTDFSLYDRVPHFGGIYLSHSHSARQLVNDIERKSDAGVREFAFFDDEIPAKFESRFDDVLDRIVERQIAVKLIALGNLSPGALTAPRVVKMRAAGYRQIYFHDDVALSASTNNDLSTYEHAVSLLREYGGYKPHTDDITAMVLVGVPGERLENVVERIVHLSHTVGSINLLPFQPTASTPLYASHRGYLNGIPLERQNGKLFPFAKYNGYTISDYQELLRLVTLLNSKFHSTTFDFLSDDPIASMVRKSVAEESWRPRIREHIDLLPK